MWNAMSSSLKAKTAAITFNFKLLKNVFKKNETKTLIISNTFNFNSLVIIVLINSSRKQREESRNSEHEEHAGKTLQQ